ncbi:MAG: GSU2403 family nucleotidyltransferase fold protein [Parvibaculaceae bacterium]
MVMKSPVFLDCCAFADQRHGLRGFGHSLPLVAKRAPVLIPTPERYAFHKLIVGSRRQVDRDPATKSSKDRLQAKSIIEVMIANRQYAELASAFMEAWDRGDHWSVAIRTSVATYDEQFQNKFRSELAKGMVEIGVDPGKYDLLAKPIE